LEFEEKKYQEKEDWVSEYIFRAKTMVSEHLAQKFFCPRISLITQIGWVMF
jgi:hypothetical protein